MKAPAPYAARRTLVHRCKSWSTTLVISLRANGSIGMTRPLVVDQCVPARTLSSSLTISVYVGESRETDNDTDPSLG